MTIISASYRTDIPAFYSDWFEARLASGYCEVKNPYNGKVSGVSLRAQDVTAFVFWTRNIKPFEQVLKKSVAGKFPFMIQFTVTGYPKLLEKSVIDSVSAVSQIRGLARDFGVDACVWRYDPILISDLTPFDFHLSKFAALAGELSGSVNEVIVSFMQGYAKTERNLGKLAGETDFNWCDPKEAQKKDLLGKFAEIAAHHGMRISLCSQPQLLTGGIQSAKCVDLNRLQKLGAVTTTVSQKGNRKGCDCYYSRDIGAYDTCPHGCLYCYAVSSPERAKRIYKNRDKALNTIAG